MARERGKGPTDVNKDRVGDGSVNNTIKKPLTTPPPSLKEIQTQRLQRSQEQKQEKPPIDKELIKAQADKLKTQVREQKPKEFTKRVDHERGK